MLLLDEMLRQGYVTSEEYESFNNALAEKDDIWKYIRSTTRFLIKDDKEELDKLIDEFKSEADDDSIVLELEKLVEQYINGKVSIEDILNISRRLENSPILLSKLHRFKMLLNDIDANQRRVETIFRRLNEIGSDESTLNRLFSEDLLSLEQREKLGTESLGLKDIADVITDTKVGRGLKFLPTTIDGLKSKFDGLSTSTNVIKEELVAILDELLRKRGITKDEYTSMMDIINED